MLGDSRRTARSLRAPQRMHSEAIVYAGSQTIRHHAAQFEAHNRSGAGAKLAMAIGRGQHALAALPYAKPCELPRGERSMKAHIIIAACACGLASCATSKPSQRPEPRSQTVMIGNPARSPMSAESVAAAGDPSPSQSETERAAEAEGYDQPVFRGVSPEQAAAASWATAKSENEPKSDLKPVSDSATAPQPARQ
jgi:hypothetical protein